ncbi:nitrite reductase (NAD(P)H) small subunit [Zhihengliuella sp.]|uniref:nitrite reductase (NAD(P)H) small subunit n=1 Tax=Zhihengliuella sp. TaxID=1954483 RepID=UPI002810DAF5|nr:nitrite reductase (NAD(P)H) small subunit [Zhihengliuella sp.]
MTILLDENADAAVTTAVDGAEVLDACRIEDLAPGWGEAAWLNGRQVALFRFPDGTVHAADQRCPATGAPVMSRGITGSRTIDGRQVRTIASPLHKEVYRLDTGECLTADGGHAGAPPRLAIFPARLEGDRVRVEVS